MTQLFRGTSVRTYVMYVCKMNRTRTSPKLSNISHSAGTLFLATMVERTRGIPRRDFHLRNEPIYFTESLYADAAHRFRVKRNRKGALVIITKYKTGNYDITSRNNASSLLSRSLQCFPPVLYSTKHTLDVISRQRDGVRVFDNFT